MSPALLRVARLDNDALDRWQNLGEKRRISDHAHRHEKHRREVEAVNLTRLASRANLARAPRDDVPRDDTFVGLQLMKLVGTFPADAPARAAIRAPAVDGKVPTGESDQAFFSASCESAGKAY